MIPEGAFELTDGEAHRLQKWYGVEDCGVFEYPGSSASSPQSLDEMRRFGRSLA